MDDERILGAVAAILSKSDNSTEINMIKLEQIRLTIEFYLRSIVLLTLANLVLLATLVTRI